MDTQKAVEALEAAGVDSRAAKAQVNVLKEALKDTPSMDRLEKLVTEAELRMTKEFHAFKFQIMWFFWALIAGVVANLVVSFWKH